MKDTKPVNYMQVIGMVVDTFLEVISFRQSKWLEKHRNCKTRKKIGLKMISKNTSINYSTTASMEKQCKL